MKMPQLLLLLITINFTWASVPKAPREIPYHVQIGQYIWSDPFHWMTTLPQTSLEEELISYISQENLYSKNWLKKHNKTRSHLLSEFKKTEPKSLYSDLEIQVQDSFEYFASKENIIRKNLTSKKSELYLKGIKVFGDTKHVISDFRISPNHRYAFFLVEDQYYLYDSSLMTAQKISTTGEISSFNGEWSKDSKGFIFALNSTVAEPSELFYQSVEPLSKPLSLLKLMDVKSEIEITLSHDQEYFIIAHKSFSHRECFTIPSNAPFTPPILLVEPKHLRFTFADHDQSGFIIQTNLNPNFYGIYRKQSPNANAQLFPLLAGSLEKDIDSIEIYNDFYLVMRKTPKGLQDIDLYNKEFQFLKTYSFDDSYYYLSIQPHRGLSHGHDKAVIIKNSVLIPEEDFSLTLEKGLQKIATENQIDYTQNYQSQRIEFKSYDGTFIPMTLIYKKGLDLTQPHFIHYAAYGCYGSLYDLNYAHGYTLYNALSLMDRDMIIAIAHVRGGGDKGLHWYLEGRDKNRMNTLDDFLAGADYLIDRGITKKKWIGISSYSAGGFIIGNAISKRPELWGAAVMYMGFTDYIGTMLDEKIAGTAKEWDLVGDPRKPATFQWMLPMSPQDNLAPNDYPPIYVWSARDDREVLFHEGVKFTAKLRQMRTNNETTLLTVIPKGKGEHHGSYTNYLNDVAQSMTFLLENLQKKN